MHKTGSPTLSILLVNSSCHDRLANNLAKADVLDASRGLPASQSMILVTLIVAAVATRYRWAFATLTYRERRRLQVRTPCEIVPSIPARRS